MARVCTICRHPQREAIETALVQGGTNRSIAKQFGVSHSAVLRHHRDHLPQVVMAARAIEPIEPSNRSTPRVDFVAAVLAEDQRGINVMAELSVCFIRVNKLFAACDAWLTDAEDDTKYDIGPRAGEVQVTYFETIAPEVVIRRKATLEDLLTRLHEGRIPVDRTQTKFADPRKLVLDTAAQLVAQLKLLVELMERAHNAERMARFEAAVVAAIGEADAAAATRLIAALRSLDGAFSHPLAG